MPLDKTEIVLRASEAVVTELPASCVDVSTQSTEDDEISITFQPKADDASRVVVSVIAAAPESIFIEIGRASTIELAEPDLEERLCTS